MLNAAVQNNNEIIISNISLARKLTLHVLHVYKISPEYFDDCFSEALLALIKIVDQYDSSRGISFESFCYKRLRGAIIDHLRRAFSLTGKRLRNSDKVKQVFVNHISSEDLDGIDFYSCDGTPEENITFKEEKTLILSLLDQLTGLDHDVLYCYYVDGKTFLDIAAQYKTTRSWISRIHTRALSKLRKLYNMKMTEVSENANNAEYRIA